MIDLRLISEKKEMLKDQIEEINKVLDVDALKEEILEIEQEFSVEGFWDDHYRANKATAILSKLKSKRALFQECVDLYDEIEIGSELLQEEDEKLYNETLSLIEKLEHKALSLFQLLLLKGKFDSNNALVEIKAGAGGTDAQAYVPNQLHQFHQHQP